MDGWSALILAGGAGRRFGGGKLAADLGGAPLVRRVAERVTAAGFAETLLITGADVAQVRAAAAGLPLRIVHAADWAEGMAATLRAGIAALSPEARGACVFLGDMPLVPTGICHGLVAAAERAGYAARVRLAGEPGHPAAFTRAAFANLMLLEGDRGATMLLRQRPEAVAYLDTAETGALFDVDTLEDLAAARLAWKA